MANLTFVHGLANKPANDVLTKLWIDALAMDDPRGVDPENRGVALKPPRSCQMVYWADVLYESPETDTSDYESVGDEAEAATMDGDAHAQWKESLPPNERRFVESLTRDLKVADKAAAPIRAVASAADEGLERVPVPAWLRNRIMERFARDAHHYFFNVEFSPATGRKYKVRDELRARFVKQLTEAQASPGPKIVISHSMGTIIAYDCLRNVPGCPPVDGLMTLGSPLGLDEVQDFLIPEGKESVDYPEAKLRGEWINIYDRLDPVAGADPNLANDYLKNGAKAIEDIHEPNWGNWRHTITKYLKGRQLRARVAKLLAAQE